MPYMDKNNNVCGFLDIEEKEASNIFSRRFFLLDRRKNILECYMDNPLNLVPGSNAITEYNLQYMSNIADAKRLKPKEPFPFYFTFAGKNIYLRASDNTDKERWISTLKEAARVVVGKKVPPRSASVDQDSRIDSRNDSRNNHVSLPADSHKSDSYQVEVYGDMVIKTQVKRSASDGDVTDSGSSASQPTCPPSWDPYTNQQQIIKRGYAVKQGQVRKNWKRRFFTLTPIAFSYYKEEEDRCAIKDITLADVIEARISVGIHLNKEHIFEVVTSHRVFYVQTETAGERDSWIRAINQCVDKLRQPRRRWHEVESQTEESVLSLSRCTSLPNHLSDDPVVTTHCPLHGTHGNHHHHHHQHQQPHHSYSEVNENRYKPRLCDCPEVMCQRTYSVWV